MYNLGKDHELWTWSELEKSAAYGVKEAQKKADEVDALLKEAKAELEAAKKRSGDSGELIQ